MPSPRNDGWHDVTYTFGDDADENARLSALLNEACHVFYHHATGLWRGADKDHFARELSKEIAARPRLVRQLLATDDRVIKMITYRAVELLKAGTPPPER